MKLKVSAAVCSHKGKIRGNNEDAFLLNGVYLPLEKMDEGGLFTAQTETPFQLYAVCDGMGGEEAGELASFAAVETFAKLLKDASRKTDVRPASVSAVQQANEAVLALDKNAGCTMTLLCLQGGKATVTWLGDSRIYLLRCGELLRLSEDHTQAQRLLNMGVFDALTAKTHPSSHELTRYIGMETEGFALQSAYGETLTLKEGDVFLLCSDGLTDMVEETEFAALLNKDAKSAAEELVSAALANGGRDNVTAMAVRVEQVKKNIFGR